VGDASVPPKTLDNAVEPQSPAIGSRHTLAPSRAMLIWQRLHVVAV